MFRESGFVCNYADSFSMVPSKYSYRIDEIFTLITENQDGLKKAFNLMSDLIQETENLMKTKSFLN